MRQFAGSARRADTNQRFKFLLEKGQDGLSTASDLPTLHGLDSDDPRSLGELAGSASRSIPIDDMDRSYERQSTSKKFRVDDD